MKNILNLINLEILKTLNDLEQIKNNKKKYPEGSIHSNKNNFYHYDKGNKTYINSSNTSLIANLIQKTYELTLEKELKVKLKHLQKFSKIFKSLDLNSIYENTSKVRKQYIITTYKSYKSLTKEWITEKYNKKPINTSTYHLFSKNGDYVRSKSECFIANELFNQMIAYRYEAELILKNYSFDNNFSEIKIYPDFTILNPKTKEVVIWEHFGMMDNVEYLINSLRKINNYIFNGYILGKNLIITFETKNFPLNSNIVQKIVKDYFL